MAEPSSAPKSWPVPAETWDDATDEHGFKTDETLPNFVYDRVTFDRWRVSLKLGALLAKANVDSWDARMAASAFYESPYETEFLGKALAGWSGAGEGI